MATISGYSLRRGKNGRLLFYRNGDLIARRDVPEKIVSRLLKEEEEISRPVPTGHKAKLGPKRPSPVAKRSPPRVPATPKKTSAQPKIKLQERKPVPVSKQAPVPKPPHFVRPRIPSPRLSEALSGQHIPPPAPKKVALSRSPSQKQVPRPPSPRQHIPPPPKPAALVRPPSQKQVPVPRPPPAPRLPIPPPQPPVAPQRKIEPHERPAFPPSRPPGPPPPGAKLLPEANPPRPEVPPPVNIRREQLKCKETSFDKPLYVPLVTRPGKQPELRVYESLNDAVAALASISQRLGLDLQEVDVLTAAVLQRGFYHYQFGDVWYYLFFSPPRSATTVLYRAA